jgi:hypothetical protein
LTQADWQLNLVNEASVPSRGWIDFPGHMWVEAWNEGAFYSPDGMPIQFDNGTVWQRVIEVPVVAPVIRRHHRHYRPIGPPSWTLWFGCGASASNDTRLHSTRTR